MSKRIYALVEPDVLNWARNSVGLTVEEAARKIGVQVTKLQEWESGESKPTITQLRKTANVYKRPLAVFFLPRPPSQYEKTFDTMRDFRRLPLDLQATSSTALHLEVRKARHRREVILELSERLGQDVPNFGESASLSEDPEQVAKRLRDLLGINYIQQTKWRDAYEALSNWKSAVEALGILVFQTGEYKDMVDITEMRGCSINLRPLPIIIINTKDWPNGRIFTLLHELTHLLLGVGGISDQAEYWNPISEEQNIEVFCNHVAGATLVPMARLLNESIVSANSGFGEWSNDELRGLSNTYSVSQEVILRRLLIAGEITEAFYKQKRREFRKELESSKSRSSSGFARYHKRVISHHGRSYIKFVLNAYYQDAINISELSGYLGVKLKHISKIEQDVMGFSSGLGVP